MIAPEEGEVIEDLVGLVEVGKRLGCEFREEGLNLLAASEVFGAVEVTELVQVAQAQAFFERDRFRVTCFFSGPLPAARRWRISSRRNGSGLKSETNSTSCSSRRYLEARAVRLM